MNGQFSVILKEDKRIDPRILTEIFTKQFSITPVEAKMILRKTRGVIAQSVTKETADLIVQTLGNYQIEADSVEMEKLPVLGHPIKVTFAQKEEEMLIYKQGNADVTEAISWDSIECVSFGIIPKEGYSAGTPEAFGIIPSLNSMEKGEAEIVKENMILKMESHTATNEEKDIYEAIEKRDLAAYIDIIDSELQWLRVNRSGFIYLVSKVNMSDLWAFKYFLKDIVNHCPKAALTDITLQLLQNRDVKNVIMLDISEFTRYTQWFFYKKNQIV